MGEEKSNVYQLYFMLMKAFKALATVMWFAESYFTHVSVQILILLKKGKRYLLLEGRAAA